MKVSIITATRNSALTIKDTLVSVNQQTHKNLEHIIIDGASTDNTLHLLHRFGHKGPLVSEADNGIYDAMNKGIMMADGDIVGILNSDDCYANAGIIEKVVKAFKNKDCDAVYGDLVYVDAHHTKKVLRKWIAGKYNKKLFYNGWMPPHPTFFVRKEVYEKYGNFNLDLKSSSDYELLLRLMFLNNIKVEYLSSILVHMRIGGHSNKSLINRIIAHKEDYKAWKANGISPRWYTLALKPLRKVKQYLGRKKTENPEIIPSPFFSTSDSEHLIASSSTGLYKEILLMPAELKTKAL